MRNENIKPFLKWAGGKRQLLPTISQYYPPKYNNYFEPFVGGGAVMFDLMPSTVTINDFNEQLTNVYKVVKNNVDSLIEQLKVHQIHNSKDYFYQIRETDRNGKIEQMTDVEKAARLIYLNKTCFNGLFRVNSKNQFNVPYANNKNPNIVNEETLRMDSSYFNETDINILTGDFEQAVAEAQKNDFIYFDPPYAPVSESSNFVAYTNDGFGYDEQKRLRDLFVSLDEKGCFVMLSNSSVDMIHELYRDYSKTTKIIQAKRAINSNGKKRGAVDEVLITNY